MKRLFVVALVILASVVRTRSQPRPRFEQLLWEDPNIDRTSVSHFEVWHDRESGQEFTCAVPNTNLASADKISCFPTGRNWK